MRVALCQVLQVNLEEPFHWCDNRCSGKALRYLQIASMVIEEGGQARTINLCKLCHNAKLVQQGKQPQKIEGMKRGVGEEGTSWQAMEDLRKRTISARDVRVFISLWAWAMKKLADAAQEKQEGTQGQWQQ